MKYKLFLLLGLIFLLFFFPKVNSLQDATIIINATNTWSIIQNSTNITGAGQTICVLDTGVNFAHPDLVGKNLTSGLIDCIGFKNPCIINNTLTDDNGHGTAVAGVIAASGGITGIAPAAKIIGVKVLDSSGSGNELDIDRGMQWCITNSRTYNISVISMSLAGTIDISYPYCDANYIGSFTTIINNATANNISVVAATGNNGNTTLLPALACIQNATSVSATNKDDTIASFVNYNNVTDLFAPSNLNTTNQGSGYVLLPQTSASAPVVAASFALIRQYFFLKTGRVLTPAQILNATKYSGKNITLPNGLNISRVNIYQAILFINSTNFNFSVANQASSTNSNISSLSIPTLVFITISLLIINILFIKKTYENLTSESGISLKGILILFIIDSIGIAFINTIANGLALW